MNQDEALRCIDIGVKAFQDKNYSKALKFFEKSHRLHPTNEAARLIARVKDTLSGGSSKPRHVSPSSTPSSRASNIGGRAPKPTPAKPNIRRTTSAPAAGGADMRGPATPQQEQFVKRIMDADNLFEALGVTKDASESDIKRAYKKVKSGVAIVRIAERSDSSCFAFTTAGVEGPSRQEPSSTCCRGF